MKEKCLLKNEDGSVLVLALVMLVLLTVLGISATTTTEIEIRIAENERSHKTAFYAAETAGAYAAGTRRDLYGSDNIDLDDPQYFPNNDDSSEKYALSSTLSFNGDVEYQGFTAPPRGSGYEAGKFKAHRYRMTCSGYGPSNSVSNIEIGFYRIGF